MRRGEREKCETLERIRRKRKETEGIRSRKIVYGFEGAKNIQRVSGDYGEGDPPVPIPNTEVKPFSAQNT